MAEDNPYRNPAMSVELGQRALQDLMTREDWDELIERHLEQENHGE